MKIPTKRLNNGFEMPVFGIGTWGMGGDMEVDMSRDKENIEALRKAIDLGIAHIDSAELYGHGHAEELVAQAIQTYERSSLFLASKVFKDHLRHADVLKSCRLTLQRMRIDYLDLYLIHAPNQDIALRETLRAFDELKEEGLIKNIGVSNFNIEQLQEAQALTKNAVVVNQIHYSLAYQKWRDVVDYCQKNDVLVTAYRPIERGILSRSGIDVLDEMCKKYERTPAQVAINWLISQNNVVTIAKTGSMQHLQENFGGLNWQMEKKDIEKLGNGFPDLELS